MDSNYMIPLKMKKSKNEVDLKFSSIQKNNLNCMMFFLNQITLIKTFFLIILTFLVRYSHLKKIPRAYIVYSMYMCKMCL